MFRKNHGAIVMTSPFAAYSKSIVKTKNVHQRRRDEEVVKAN
jgi:hypothetical protein